MGNSKDVREALTALMEDQDRNAAWLSRRSGVPYKRVLNEIIHGTRPLSLETAIAACAALGTTLAALLQPNLEQMAVAS